MSFEALLGGVNVDVTAETTAQGHSIGLAAYVTKTAYDDTFDVERIIGTRLTDVFRGGVAQFWGGNGNDVFIPGNGDHFNGKGGIDAIDFSVYSGPVNFNLGSTSLPTGETFANFERVNGTTFNDVLSGT